MDGSHDLVQGELKSLNVLQSVKCDTNASTYKSYESELERVMRENASLQNELRAQKATVSRLEEALQSKEKEIVQFVMTGGAIGGEIRDKVIKTLQEQLLVREEEIQFYRSDRLDAQEEQKKGERLLISAIHSIGLQYHEEMVRQFEQRPPSIPPQDALAHEVGL